MRGWNCHSFSDSAVSARIGHGTHTKFLHQKIPFDFFLKGLPSLVSLWHHFSEVFFSVGLPDDPALTVGAASVVWECELERKDNCDNYIHVFSKGVKPD